MERALAEGVVDPGDDLLEPRFYLAPGLSGWIEERIDTMGWPFPAIV